MEKCVLLEIFSIKSSEVLSDLAWSLSSLLLLSHKASSMV